MLTLLIICSIHIEVLLLLCELNPYRGWQPSIYLALQEIETTQLRGEMGGMKSWERAYIDVSLTDSTSS